MRLLRPLLLLAVLLGGCQSTPPPAPPTATPTVTPTPVIGVQLITRAPPTVAVVQVTPTPLPTATPTPTATPVTYAIAEGDTLWVVAFKNYTMVDDILALNPGLRPELLQIGQLIQLPPPATPVFQAAGRTPVPLQVQVTSLRIYETPLGRAWIVGEVRNDTPAPVENIRVGIVLSDQSGAMAQEVVAWVVPGIIPTGGTAPFGVLLPGAAAGFAASSTTIAGGSVVTDLGTRYLDLAVRDARLTVDEGRVVLTGTVVNTGLVSAEPVVLVATLYDNNGAVSGFSQLLLAEPLPPQAERTFTIDVAPPGGDTVDFNLTVQGIVASSP